MKLDLTPRQLLALYDHLRYNVVTVYDDCDYKAGDGAATPDNDTFHLKQLYARLRGHVLDQLTTPHVADAQAWLAQEQAKVDRLNAQLADVKDELPKVVAQGLIKGKRSARGPDRNEK